MATTRTKEERLALSNEILNQIGGMNRLHAMTGAYNFLAIEDGVSFKIKNQKANYIKITVNGLDLYDLEVGRIRGNTYKIVVSEKDLYGDMLKSQIEEATGMTLTMPRVVGFNYKEGGVLKDLLNKSQEKDFVEYAESIISSDSYYDKNAALSISKLVVRVDEILLKYTPENPIITKFGELAYFYPMQEHIMREGLEKAYIKYAAHLVTRKDKKGRTIDVSKERAIHLIYDALTKADNRYIHTKEDGSESIIYIKHHAEKKGMAAMALVVEMNNLGQLRMVSFMPDRKKISDTWIEASPILYHAELDDSANQNQLDNEVDDKINGKMNTNKKNLKNGGELNKNKYKLGDKYSSNFDYEGMLVIGLKATPEWGVKKLQKLADSFEGVNYSTVSEPLFAAIGYLKEDNKDGAEKSLFEFYDKIMEEFNKIAEDESSDIDSLLEKQTKLHNQLTDIKLNSDLTTKKGVETYRKKIEPINKELTETGEELDSLGYESYAKGGGIYDKEFEDKYYKDLEEQRARHKIEHKEKFFEMIKKQKNPMKTVNEADGLKVGDKVTFTNDYGVVFKGHEVLAIEDTDDEDKFYLDTDAYWFPHKRSQLYKENKSYGVGGSIAEQNKQMVQSQAKEIGHHINELLTALEGNEEVPAWVVAKTAVASSDLSDVAHYLDGIEKELDLKHDNSLDVVDSKLNEIEQEDKDIESHVEEPEHEEGDYGIDGFAKGGVIVELDKFRKNRMGTLSFDMKISGMRNNQDFIVYPASQKSDSILIQSDTRIGKINMTDGKGIMSQSHSNGAYGHHLSTDKLTAFELTQSQLQELKEKLSGTVGDSVGTRSILSDNSYADKFAKGGIIVTKISDIPDLESEIEKGKVTYRGLGMGKLSDDFWDIAKEGGTRIKVKGKEYFITDTEFRKLAWDNEKGKWSGKIKFDAPYRKFAEGGDVSEKGMTKDQWHNLGLTLESGISGFSHKVKGGTNKKGDVCTGYINFDEKPLFFNKHWSPYGKFVYVDKDDNEYSSTEIPSTLLGSKDKFGKGGRFIFSYEQEQYEKRLTQRQIDKLIKEKKEALENDNQGLANLKQSKINDLLEELSEYDLPVSERKERGGGISEIDMDKIEKNAIFYTDDSRWNPKPTIKQFEDEIIQYGELKEKLDNHEIKPSKIIGTGFKPNAVRPLAYKWLNENILIAKRAIEILKEREGKMAKGGRIIKGDKVTAWGKGGVGEMGEVIDILPKDKHGIIYYEIMLNDSRGKTYAKRSEITKEDFAKGGRIKELEVGQVYVLPNDEEIEIVRFFKENINEEWVEFLRDGKSCENSIKTLIQFLKNWNAQLKESTTKREILINASIGRTGYGISKGQIVTLPKDLRLTIIGLEDKINRGIKIATCRYKITDIYEDKKLNTKYVTVQNTREATAHSIPYDTFLSKIKFINKYLNRK